ncbi:MAG: CinA family protein [Deltaproteobacteria bacterium]|nr:CinA family protein [Deltaproteobacteria bacterium]
MQKLLEQVAQKLITEKKTIAVAESCTGGMLGKLLTDRPGSSEYFKGGVISYSNQIKIELLGVSKKVLEDFGAVSAEVAVMMAAGVKKVCKSDYALSVTGVAGPDGGSAEKPVGTFYLGLATPNGIETKKCFYPGTRDEVRISACKEALSFLYHS